MPDCPTAIKLVPVRWDFLLSKTARWRGFHALGIIAAFLFTIALAVAPRLHEQLHQQLGAGHECAVTMFTHGNFARLTTAAPTVAPLQVVWSPLPLPPQLPSLAENLEFSLLEHAPPSLA